MLVVLCLFVVKGTYIIHGGIIFLKNISHQNLDYYANERIFV